jgi:hypothetical protein
MDLGPCPLCGRPMTKGAAVDRHHWVPRKHGGAAWSWMHRFCHKKLHSLYDEKTLATKLNSAEALLAEDDLRTFVAWVRRQPPDRVGRHAKPKRR